MPTLPSLSHLRRFALPALAIATLISAQLPSVAKSVSPIRSKLRAPRIVGGTVAPNHAYPWMVALETSGTNGFQFCGGTLISRNKVLTAAHCSNFVSNPRVRIGSNLLTTGTLVNVTTQVIHPKYNNNTLDYDVAVWTLATPVTPSDNVNFVELPEACPTGVLDCVTGLTTPGVIVKTIGWGTLTENGSSPNDLRQVDVPLVSNATCNLPIAYNNTITPRMICAGLAGGTKDSCQGDSGGPLFGYYSFSRTGIQTGIVSTGEGCARPNKYGIYTRIANPEVRSFIKTQAGV